MYLQYPEFEDANKMLATKVKNRWEEERREGWQEGRVEGAYEKAVKVAECLLKKGFSETDIAEAVDLPLHRIGAIKAAINASGCPC